ncbi:MAG: hypothetical protein ACKV0T_11815 [Planctomycetales bacterium]
MTTFFRTLVAVVVGVFNALILLIGVELFSAVVHPVPPDFGGTMAEMCQHVARYPQWVLAVVVPAWGATAFLSTWTARKIGNRGSGLFIGFLLLSAVVFNVTQLPYPIWFKIVILIVVPAAIFLGGRQTADRQLSGGNELD